MDDNKNFYNQEYKINITLASQMELSNILSKIALLDATNPIDSPEKQKCKLSLIIHYLIRATPYLSETDSEKYKKELLPFGVNRKVEVKHGTQTLNYKFNRKLDFRLNEILIELQQKLRRVFTKMEDEEDDGLW